jgi:hypothetical protein
MYEYSVEEQAMQDACAILNKLGLTDEITKAIAEKNPDPRIQKIHAHVLAFLSTFSQLESQEVQSPVQTDEFRRLFDYIKSHTPEGVIPQGYGWEGMDVVMPRPLSKDDVQLLKQPLITAVTQNGSLESPNRDFSIYNLGVTLAGTPGNHSIDSRPVHINVSILFLAQIVYGLYEWLRTVEIARMSFITTPICIFTNLLK